MEILTIAAITLGLLSFIIPDFIIPAIILAALPYLRSYFVKPQKAVAAVSSSSTTSSSSFINKDLFKKTVLKTNNNNSNTTSNTKWSSIWKWSKKASSSSTNSSTTTTTTTKAIINKKSTNNGDNENSWGIPTLRLRDHNGDIIPINSNTAVPIDTKYFKGEILFMLKCEGQLSSYNRYRNYFSSKAANDGRKFEIQIQGQFKYNPKGLLYAGAEVEGPVRLFQNVVGRIASMLLNLTVRFYPYTHFSYGDEYSSNGLFEKAHLSFPLFQIADRFIATKVMPGNPPPDLGIELPENEFDRAKRRSKTLKDRSSSSKVKKDKGVYSQFNTNASNASNEVHDASTIQKGVTYTFSLESSYLDFSSWNVFNIPGSRPVSIAAFIGKKPLHIVLYEQDNQKHMINGETGLAPHFMRSKKYILALELSHIGIIGGHDEKLHNDAKISSSDDEISNLQPFSSKDDASNNSSTSKLFYNMYGNDYDEQVGVGDTGVPSNEDIPLIVLPAPWETKGALQQTTCYPGPNRGTWMWNKPNRGRKSMKRLIEADMNEKDILHAATDMTASVQCLDDIGGYAVRTVCSDVKAMKFIKVTVSEDIFYDDEEFQSNDVDDDYNDIDDRPIMLKKKHNNAMPSFVPCDDNSILRCGDTVRIICSESGSCLEANKNQYLTLFKKLDPSINGVFQITILDDRGKIMYGMPLTRGKTFRLRSVRYSKFEVGCLVNDSREDAVHNDGSYNGSYKLVLYEWNTKKNVNEPIKWGRHGTVNPLYLCVIGDSMRSVNERTPASTNNDITFKGNKKYQKIKEDSINPDTDPFYSYSIEIAGWVHILHRTTLKRTLAFIIVSNFEKEEGVQSRWTSLRTALELDGMLNNAEEIAGCGKFKGVDNEEVIEENDDVSQYEHEAHLNRPVPLPHELPIEQSLRLFRHRLFRVIQSLHDTNNNDIFNQSNDAMMKMEMVQRAFLKFLIKPRILDSWFLLPGIDQSSISASICNDNSPSSPGKKPKANPKLVSTPKIFTVPVARALWDDHWQEEIMTVLKGVVIFRPPSCIAVLSSPVQQLVLHLGDVKNVVEIPFEDSPLPGLYLLRLEAVDRVHYVCFSDKDVLDTALTTLLEHMSDLHYSSRSMEEAIDIAAEALVSHGKSNGIAGNVLASSIKNFDKEPHLSILSGRWMPTKYGPRYILNSRRSYFDKISSSLVEDDHDNHDNEPYYLRISIKLLKEVFNLCRETNRDSSHQNDDSNSSKYDDNSSRNNDNYDFYDDPVFGHLDNISMDQLTSFLDNTVDLKQINLDDIDFGSNEALCFFVNVYHVLLLHSRLVLEMPNKATWAGYHYRACYEIGDDVFSLAEIEHCVVRGGSLSSYDQKKIKSISRHAAQPPSESDSHYAYSLSISDKRAHFLLNNGSVSHPHTIFLLSSDNFEVQLDKATHAMIVTGMRIDLFRRELILPKVCKVFLNDDDDDEPAYDEDGYEIKVSDAEKLARRCLQMIEHYQDTYSEDLVKLLNDYDDDEYNDDDNDDNNPKNKSLGLKFLRFQYNVHDVISLSR